MQNDMLKTNIAPWQEKGRWYHILLESDGTSWTLDVNNTDEKFKTAFISSNIYIYASDTSLKYIDVKLFYHNSIANTGFNTQAKFRHSTIQMGIIIPSPSQYTGKLEIWAFVVS